MGFNSFFMDSESPSRYREVHERPRRRLEYTNSTMYQDYSTTNRDDYFQRQPRYLGHGRGPKSGRRPPRPTRTSNTQPVNLEHKKLVRKMFDLIRMIHHRENVSLEDDPNNQPPAFRRIANYLASIIKPVALNEETQLKIEGNARNWAYTTQLILVDHYDESIHYCLKELEPLLKENWRQAFNDATRWAQKQFKRRLHSEAIKEAETLLVDTVQASTSSQPRQDDSDQTQRTPTLPVPNQGDNILQDGELTWSPLNPFYLDCQTDAIIHHLPCQEREAKHQRTRYPCILSETDPLLNIDLDNTGSEDLNEVGNVTHNRESQTEGNTYLVDSDSGGPVQSPQVSSRDPETEKHTMTNLETKKDQRPFETTKPGQSPALTRETGSTPSFTPTRHSQITKKMLDWSLTAQKKWLIMGDSNVARLPDHNISNLQIDSYPGSNFRHAEAILGRAKSSDSVEKIILAFGILHMEQKPKKTAVKQLQKALKMAKEKFPQAEVWIPLINFSEKLETEHQNNLEEFNAHIQANMPFIPKLPADLFHTEDKIHWSKSTAEAMFQHWAKHLNSSVLEV